MENKNVYKMSSNTCLECFKMLKVFKVLSFSLNKISVFVTHATFTKWWFKLAKWTTRYFQHDLKSSFDWFLKIIVASCVVNPPFFSASQIIPFSYRSVSLRTWTNQAGRSVWPTLTCTGTLKVKRVLPQNDQTWVTNMREQSDDLLIYIRTNF